MAQSELELDVVAEWAVQRLLESYECKSWEAWAESVSGQTRTAG